MTTWVMLDEDYSPAGIKRRLKEEFVRRDISSESMAAEMYGRPQQWVSRRMTGESKWYVGELEDFCRALGLSYVYVTTGIRHVTPPPTPPAQPFREPRAGRIKRALQSVADVAEDKRPDRDLVDARQGESLGDWYHRELAAQETSKPVGKHTQGYVPAVLAPVSSLATAA